MQEALSHPRSVTMPSCAHTQVPGTTQEALSHPPSVPLPLCTHAQVPGTTQEALYLTAKVAAINTQVLLELRMSAGYPGVDVSFKSERADLAAMTFDAVAKVLS